jgi:hypothetical protein
MTLSLLKNEEILNVIEAIEVTEAARKPAIYGNLTFFRRKRRMVLHRL